MDTLQNFYLLLPRSLCHLFFFFFKGGFVLSAPKTESYIMVAIPTCNSPFSSAFPRLWTVDCGSRVLRRYIPLRSSHM